MARPIQVAIDCQDPDRLAAFWAEVLEYRLSAPPSGYTDWSEYSRAVAAEVDEAWSLLVDPAGVGPSVLFHRVPESKVVKNRVHLDVHVTPRTGEATTRALVDAEVRRLVGLGAIHIRTDDDENDYHAVMQDPEGNEFCVD